MKKLYCILILLSVCYTAESQTASSDSLLVKFKTYYQTGQTDSVFSMFSGNMKKALSLNATKTLLANIKTQLGEIKNSEFLGLDGGDIISYELTFERPLVDLVIAFKDYQIIGISQKAAREKKNAGVLSAVDNISVKTLYGSVYGTLKLPEIQNGSKVPVVILVAGSGPTDRNMNQGTQLKTNAFKFLAEELAGNGIASVRYDKRGIGKSISSQLPSSVTIEDFANDVSMFIEMLKVDPRFSKVIVLGHSEGATVGLIASLKDVPSAFISISGAASDLGAILRKQLKTSVNSGDYKIATGILDSLRKGKTVQAPIPSSLMPLFNSNVQHFIISSMKYNAANLVSQLHIPTLIIGGTRDLQIGADNATKLYKARGDAKLYIIDGMNHVLKDVTAGKDANMNSYFDNTLPLHKDLVPVLVKFIKNIH